MSEYVIKLQLKNRRTKNNAYIKGDVIERRKSGKSTKLEPIVGRYEFQNSIKGLIEERSVRGFLLTIRDEKRISILNEINIFLTILNINSKFKTAIVYLPKDETISGIHESDNLKCFDNEKDAEAWLLPQKPSKSRSLFSKLFGE